MTNKEIDRYFGFLSNLDINSKKKLIIKLTESIKVEDDNKFDLKSLFGAWVDIKDSDEIIKEIRKSRVDSNDIAEF